MTWKSPGNKDLAISLILDAVDDFTHTLYFMKFNECFKQKLNPQSQRNLG
ncbi:hypothetical protein [Criblamydia sequanensis]|nr:hypothetical protein [Criblamydia sequanensis]